MLKAFGKHTHRKVVHILQQRLKVLQARAKPTSSKQQSQICLRNADENAFGKHTRRKVGYILQQPLRVLQASAQPTSSKQQAVRPGVLAGCYRTSLQACTQHGRQQLRKQHHHTSPAH